LDFLFAVELAVEGLVLSFGVVALGGFERLALSHLFEVYLALK